MSLIHSSLRVVYRGIRRAAVLDVKRLLHLPAAVTVQWSVPSAYRLASLSADELERRLAEGTAPASIGPPDRLADGRQDLIAAFDGSQIAAYVWLARDWVSAEENFSRSRHLGTSLQLPEGSVFVHTAFTEPAHRGRRLLGGMLGWARAGGVVGAERMFATMDWTNEPSRRAFMHLGFQPLGLIYRMGRGPMQCSLYPAAAAKLGLQVATHCGGVRFAVG